MVSITELLSYVPSRTVLDPENCHALSAWSCRIRKRAMAQAPTLRKETPVQPQHTPTGKALEHRKKTPSLEYMRWVDTHTQPRKKAPSLVYIGS